MLLSLSNTDHSGSLGEPSDGFITNLRSWLGFPSSTSLVQPLRAQSVPLGGQPSPLFAKQGVPCWPFSAIQRITGRFNSSCPSVPPRDGCPMMPYYLNTSWAISRGVQSMGAHSGRLVLLNRQHWMQGSSQRSQILLPILAAWLPVHTVDLILNQISFPSLRMSLPTGDGDPASIWEWPGNTTSLPRIGHGGKLCFVGNTLSSRSRVQVDAFEIRASSAKALALDILLAAS
ncbi:hypothetical protein F5Y18DRAFT_235068 [Xylariaceae sp. FL1019]|nr:hypothetical protein F5Y18DRAFT_235068 [Xylariaceae sp. FL1019]